MEEGGFKVAIRLFHLASFSGWLGTQLWVTFFAGLTMFRLLPRHMFGYVQSKLFPKYFLLGTVLSSVSMVTFIIEHPFGSWDKQQTIQGSILGISLLTVIASVIYISPSIVKTISEQHKIEKEEGAGQAVGKVEEEKLIVLKKNPKYVSLSKKFVRLHTFSAIANLLTFCAQGVHLVYLAANLVSL